MVLKKITISNFKMFEHLELVFEPGFNLILGDNGVGKTTVLEAASVVLSGFLIGIEDVYARSIYKNDVKYQIVKDSNGTPNKSYSNLAEVSGTLEYSGTDYTWTRTKKDATGNSRTTIIPKDIVRVSQELVNDPGVKTLSLVSYQSASRHWVTARSDANRKKETSSMTGGADTWDV
ncbi:MAG: ATP-binding protein [Lachnospiraceae bacterium]|nr:ATP-binding protein [Lachnospiraceae bacterium]